MRARLLAGLAVSLAVGALILAEACSNDALPVGDFPLDAAALDLQSCSDGSRPIEIPSSQCPAAACAGSVAYALCTGTSYSACSCKGPPPDDDALTQDEPFPTGSGEGGAPPVDGEASESGPGDGGSEGGPADSGADVRPADSGAPDVASKDSGKAKDAGAKG